MTSLYRAKGNGRNRVAVAGSPAEMPASHGQAAGVPRKRRRKEEGAVTNGAPESCIA
jgi:hypothetical protein